jgi:hypothetical protein
MRNYWILAALGMVLMLTAPALAIEADFSGEYRVEGIYNDHLTLIDDDDSASDAYMQMRLRLKTDFTISDNVSLTTRLDGLHKRWGDSDESKVESDSESFSGTASANYPAVRTTSTIEDHDDNIDLEWVYMTLKTSFGGFLVGRQNGNKWGLTFSDTEGPRDRITYILPIENTIIAAVYEKTRELDGNNLTKNDADIDKYYLTATQKGENFKAGFLYGFYNYKTFQEIWQNRQSSYLKDFLDAQGNIYTSSDTGYLISEIGANVLIPYFDGKFGPLGVKAELNYAFGDVKYDDPYHVTPTDAQFAPVLGTGDSTLIAGYLAQGVENSDGNDTKKGNAYAYNVELSYDYTGFTFTAGYAYCSGDADPNDDKEEAFAYVEPGEDWQKLAILNGRDYGTLDTLGGMGNLSGGGKPSWDGYKMFYLGADYTINDQMKVGLLYGKSEADKVTEEDSDRATVYAYMETLSGDDFANNDWDKNHGQEYDLTFEWQIFPNLKYNFIAAYLDVGDYWKRGDDDTDLKNTYLLFHRLTVEF